MTLFISEKYQNIYILCIVFKNVIIKKILLFLKSIVRYIGTILFTFLMKFNK